MVANGNHPRNRVCVLVSEGGRRWWSKTETTLENERPCSCLRVVEGVVVGARLLGGGGKRKPPSKLSVRACVRGWEEVVVARWWWQTETTLENERAHSCPRVVDGGDGDCQVPGGGSG
jgi:hypothetical protein